MTATLDQLARPLRDLRMSVTDRCNFRCSYCMPMEIFGRDFAFLPRSELLSFEEILRLSRLFVAEGVTKVRLTGGEPLLRRDLERLVEMLARLDGITDIALTTNGASLVSRARALADAGLSRVTVSLDALDDGVFAAMNGVGFPVARVLAGIDAAADAGLAPVKVNMVVRRGVNDHCVLEMAEHFRRHGHVASFHRVHGRGDDQPLEPGRRGSGRRDPAHDRRLLAAGAAAARLSGRGGHPLPLPRRRRGDRPHRLGHPTVLRKLHARPPLRRGQAPHLPVRDVRTRSPRPAARRSIRSGDHPTPTLDLGRAGRPLLGGAHRYGAGQPKVEMSYIGG